MNTILDIVKDDILPLFNIVNESNYEEISRLVRFLKNKLQMNMWIVENEKRKFYFKMEFVILLLHKVYFYQHQELV